MVIIMIGWILSTVVGAATIAYLYLNRVYSYWRRRGLAQPPTVYGFGNMLDAFLMKKSPGYIYSEIYHSYPEQDAVGVYSCQSPKLLVRSPELIQRVMVSDFSSFHDNEFFVTKRLDPNFYKDPFVLKGEEWKPARSKLVATVSPARIKEIFPLMLEVIPRLEDYIDSQVGKEVQAKELAQLFVMDSVSSTVFGINSNCFTDPEAAFRKIGDLQMKELRTWWKSLVMNLLPEVRDLIGLKFMPSRVSDFITKLLQDVVDFRKKNNISRNDLLQYFMKKETGDNMEEVMFYGFIFFIEGFETSAMTGSKALYELAMNPDVQQTLYEEVRHAFGDKPVITYDTINNLPYLDKVLKEAMRKYPLAYVHIRKCTSPVTLDIDGKPVDVEVGTPVIIPVFGIHRDPNYYPDPDVFDPERFNEQNTLPPCTYLPFGEGPRICPGMRFGVTQVKLLISSIVYKYRILRTENTPRTLTFMTGSSLVIPNETAWLRLEKRT